MPREIERIADQRQKGVSLVPSASVYMTGDWAARHFHHADPEVIEQIIALSTPFIASTNIQAVQLKRWDYAETALPLRSPFIEVGVTHPLLVGGDAFLHADDPAGRTRIESAFLSGVAAAERLFEKLRI
ncbi:hypothetical protein BEP19_09040 [Ammoniphilus oxalaticus]|uniref:Amine oxidase domain-containing protein n=1 Tax=Ammoniphilus oxalaticus TaxID=66863 RepID=A0A419SKP1_9BACL|nr:hypothetical protein [Ammoniphilus oxalaticus]RKD24519.1 hypothetical protein BEP19_09040 [Ammoniphilus oxalaticus]